MFSSSNSLNDIKQFFFLKKLLLYISHSLLDHGAEWLTHHSCYTDHAFSALISVVHWEEV